jgi:glutamine amidotransferase
MQQLRENNLVDDLRALTQPVLGICLGMQLLFTRSDEGQGVGCLDVIAGDVTHLKAAPGRPVPHMGWNSIHPSGTDHPLLRRIPDGSFLYFAHSYALPASEYALASSQYGEPFAAVVARNNYFGCQFHPERSGPVGQQFIANFLGL